MIATAIHTGQLIVYITSDPIDDAAVASVKEAMPGVLVLADLLEPLYDASVPTREAFSSAGSAPCRTPTRRILSIPPRCYKVVHKVVSGANTSSLDDDPRRMPTPPGVTHAPGRSARAL